MDLEQNSFDKNAYARKSYAEKRKLQLEQREKYNEEHQEEIAEVKRQKELKNQELNKARCKQYRESHKEEVKAMKQRHYENNKDKILEKQKEMILCDVCGCETTKHHLPRHMRSNKCKLKNKPRNE